MPHLVIDTLELMKRNVSSLKTGTHEADNRSSGTLETAEKVLNFFFFCQFKTLNQCQVCWWMRSLPLAVQFGECVHEKRKWWRNEEVKRTRTHRLDLFAICIPNKHCENFRNITAIWSEEPEDRLISLILIILIILLIILIILEVLKVEAVCDVQARVDGK